MFAEITNGFDDQTRTSRHCEGDKCFGTKDIINKENCRDYPDDKHENKQNKKKLLYHIHLLMTVS